MIKLFRNIRKNLLNEGKTTKYFKYAIGEVLLVVIGILIALQINNANELSKQSKQAKTYEQSLITELKEGLNNLNTLDSLFKVRLKPIDSYISYHENPNIDADIVIQKMDSIRFDNVRDRFNNKVYVIEDIISTGNLTLFSKEKKEAILKLNNTKELIEKIKIEVDQERFLTNSEFENAVDIFSYYKIKPTSEDKAKNWKYNLESEQYRLFNNKILKESNVYNFRFYGNDQIRAATENLLKILEEK